MELKKSDFYETEDALIEVECGDCGNMHLTDMELNYCESCGSDNLINYTSHEGIYCGLCSHTFDMWEDGYRWDGGVLPEKLKDVLICTDCYDELED